MVLTPIIMCTSQPSQWASHCFCCQTYHIVSQDNVMSLAGFMSSQYHLGICVPSPPVLPVVGELSKDTDGPAQRVSKLHVLQPLRLVLAEEEGHLCLSSFT